MKPVEIVQYYSRPDIQQAMLAVARNREVAGVYESGSFGSRPGVLQYPQDIVSLARAGVVEFHCSIERWSNPMLLKADNYQQLRTGWDLILDIDCERLEHGKIATALFVGLLQRYGINNVSVKFTGGTGFHIGVAWESFPQTINYTESARLFPDVARQIGLYLKHQIRGELEGAFLHQYTLRELAEQTGKPAEEIATDTGIDPFKIADVDPILISPRHLFRMPYSLHWKSFLVSLPIDPAEITRFEPAQARPEQVRAERGFLGTAEEGEAELLVIEALDWHAMKQKREAKTVYRERQLKEPIPPALFPPCIRIASEGLADGKKRSLFVLLNFLSSMSWSAEAVETYVREWNQKNRPPLPESYLRGQLRWHQARGKLSPPNCDKEAWYVPTGLCQPDQICGGPAKSIGNPINYPFRKMGRENKGGEKRRMVRARSERQPVRQAQKRQRTIRKGSGDN